MSSKALIAIVGPSGSGKSSSLRYLDPLSTRIIDLELKGFPFKGAEKFIVERAENPKQFDDALTKVIADPVCKLIVIESFGKYVERVLSFCQKAYTGYDIYAKYAAQVRNTLNKCRNTQAAVVWTAIDDIVEVPMADGSNEAQRCIEVHGKELRGKIEREFLMVFFTVKKPNKDGRMEYFFATNTDGITTAKTPADMFKDQLIPNDLAGALKIAREYYGSEKAEV